MEKVPCDVCQRKFKSPEALNQHKNDAHKQIVKEEHKAHHKKKMGLGKALAFLIPVLIVAGVLYGVYWALTTEGIGSIGSTHIHADFAIYINGQEITPLPRQYYVLSPYAHVEEGPGEGTVIHMHATGVPLKMFFKSLGMTFNSECFDVSIEQSIEQSYCNSGSRTLKMFVKHDNSTWEQSTEYENYVFRDLDKILITYGNDNEDQITAQQNNVTDFSKDNSGGVMSAYK